MKTAQSPTPIHPNGTATREDEQQALTQQVGQVPLQAVPCTLPGYEGVVFHFNVSNAYAVAQVFRNQWYAANHEQRLRMLAWFIPKVGITAASLSAPNFLVGEDEEPALSIAVTPDPEQPITYEWVAFDLPLMGWLRGEGYSTALSKALGN